MPTNTNVFVRDLNSLAEPARNLYATKVFIGGVEMPSNFSTYATQSWVTAQITAANTDPVPLSRGGLGKSLAAFDGLVRVSGGNATYVTCSVAGAGLLAAADYAAQRAALGLVIGTNVQAYNATLANLATASTTAGNLPVMGASGLTVLGTPGSSGLVLTSDLAQPGKMRWATASSGGGTSLPTPVKGAVLVGNGSAWVALAPSTDGYAMVLDSNATAGVKWASVSSGGALSDGNKGDVVVSAAGSLWNLATVSGLTAGTYGRVTVDTKGRVTAAAKQPIAIVIPITARDEAVTVGSSLYAFELPLGMTLSEVRASTLAQAPTGSAIVVDVLANGNSVLGNPKLSIPANSMVNISSPSITTPSLADRTILSIDVTQKGSTLAGMGLTVTLIGVL